MSRSATAGRGSRSGRVPGRRVRSMLCCRAGLLCRAERGWLTCDACTEPDHGRPVVLPRPGGDLPGDEGQRAEGLATLISFGSKIRKSVEAQPDGLLLHENLLFSLFPPQAAMRQYWRDFDSLERWARSLPHQQWWQQFLRDRGGTGFWHETYFRGGQIESVYIDMPGNGLAKFAPVTPARGSLFSARRRLGMREGSQPPPGIAEEELYQR